MAPLTSIRTSEGKLEIVNQLLLPHTTEFITIETIEHAHHVIEAMKAGNRQNIFNAPLVLILLIFPDSRSSCDRFSSSSRCCFPPRKSSEAVT